MRKIVNMLLLTMLMGLILVGCGSKEQTSNKSTNEIETETLTNPKIEIEIENYGIITLELDANAAPITVKNFLKLVNENFYDGLTFHRIINGFMMQGGDPTGTGMGGSAETINGEFTSNGVNNDLSHTKGAISMARSLEPDSASSQFFIVHEDSKFLDGDYAAFGYVIDGIALVDKICKEAIAVDGNGTIEPANQPIIKSIRVLN